MNSLRSAWTPVLASQNASIIGPRERFEDSPLARTSFASYPTIRLVQIIGQATGSQAYPQIRRMRTCERRREESHIWRKKS